MGKKIDHEDSVYYWCYKNNIPVFCPGFTDGAVGDALYFSSYRLEDFKVDLTEDLIKLYQIAENATKTGAIILGGGVIKHHVLRANAIRGGLDFTVMINDGLDFDGSESGTKPKDEISSKRIKKNSKFIKLHSEVTLVFPLIIARTFAQDNLNN